MVYEEPDGSLLTSIRQTWWLAVPTVLDADNGAIAMIYRRLLEWPDERVMAEIVKTGRHKGEFHAAVGVELANYAKQSDGILLTFHPRISSEPFIKMAILGAVLTRC